MIKLGHVLPMEEVADARTPTRAWCLRCWNVCMPGPRLDNIKNGKQGACEHCGGKKRLTEEMARERAWDWGYIPDPKIPYTNDATKWPGLCRAKNHYCEPVLNCFKRSGPCQRCADSGFKPDRPALLYLVVRPDLVAAKIGICEDSPKNSRLYGHMRNGWTKVRTRHFDIGAAARTVEDTVIRSWRARGFLPVLDNGFGYNGYTETVSLNELSADEIWLDVCSLAEVPDS
jgi:hypothetical protein